MPKICDDHLEQLTRVSMSNRRELVKLKRLYRDVLLPVMLFLWLSSLLIIKLILNV